MPFEWYRKKQSIAEIVTYGCEFMAARIARDKIITHRNMLQYLGVPIQEITHMFGDNKSIIDGSMTNHAKLHK